MPITFDYIYFVRIYTMEFNPWKKNIHIDVHKRILWHQKLDIALFSNEFIFIEKIPFRCCWTRDLTHAALLIFLLICRWDFLFMKIRLIDKRSFDRHHCVYVVASVLHLRSIHANAHHILLFIPNNNLSTQFRHYIFFSLSRVQCRSALEWNSLKEEME